MQGIVDGIWNHAFLQACHEEPFVRRAIIAIAALSKAMEVFQPSLKGVKALPDINDISSQSQSSTIFLLSTSSRSSFNQEVLRVLRRVELTDLRSSPRICSAAVWEGSSTNEGRHHERR